VDNDIDGCLVDIDCFDVTVSGNSVKTGATLGSTNAGIFCYDAQQVAVTSNSVDGGKNGILISTGTTGFSVTGNTVSNTSTHGIAVSNSTSGTVSGNSIVSSGHYGISVSSSASQVSVTANCVRSAGYDGIFLSGTSSVTVGGNECLNSNGSGIFANGCSSVTLAANVCLNNNVNNGSSESAGIRLLDSSQINVIGNRCLDSRDSGSRTQNYGVSEEGTSANNFYIGNDFATNKTADTNFVGATNVYVANGANLPMLQTQNGAVSSPAYSFTSATNTGMYRTGGGNIAFAVNGEIQGAIHAASGAVNYPVLRGSSTTGVTIFPEGTGANVTMALHGKGTSGAQIAATGQPIGFIGTTPVAKQTVSGSRGGNAALESLLTALSNYGLVTDSTTA
jgi:parallel beta-helix repeat protein